MQLTFTGRDAESERRDVSCRVLGVAPALSDGLQTRFPSFRVRVVAAAIVGMRQSWHLLRSYE